MVGIRTWVCGTWPYRVVAVVWMAVIFYLSSKSDLPSLSLFWGEDKVAHGVFFGVLGFFYVRSLRPWDQVLSLKELILVTVMVTAYGAIDEIHQTFVMGREASLGDLAADAAGGLIAAAIFWRRSPFARFLTPSGDKGRELVRRPRRANPGRSICP